jgi:hypothetical protein
MNIKVLWPRLHKGSHICLILSVFMTEQKNKCVHTGLILLVTVSLDSNINTPTVYKNGQSDYDRCF